MEVSSAATDGIIGALSNRAGNRQALSSSALSRGATRLQSQDFEGAITEFKRAAAYDPELTVAYQYQGRVYTMMGRRDDAIDAYRRAVRSDPTNSDARTELAKAYLNAQRFGDAEIEFKKVAQANRADAGAAAQLGYLYLSQGRLAEADTQFTQVTHLAPKAAASWRALGQVRNAQGRFGEAIKLLDRAISLDPKYADAYSDRGYAYFAMEDRDKAQQQVDQLYYLDTDRSVALGRELELSMFTPEIAYLDPSRSTFLSTLGPGTSLSTLDPSLATPGASKTFTMTFRFNQPMDLVSIQDTYNWSISKASGGTAGVYNHGANLHPDREVDIMPLPISVRYDPEKQTATVYFKVTQNANGDGLIDPSHWVFQFRGSDASGSPMDRRADQYSGYVKSPF